MLFHCNIGYMDAPQRYVIRTLPVFFYLNTVDANEEIYLDVLKLGDVSLLDLLSK